MSLVFPVLIRNIKYIRSSIKLKSNVNYSFTSTISVPSKLVCSIFKILSLYFILSIYIKQLIKPKFIHTTKYRLYNEQNKPFLDNPFENDLLGYHEAVSQAMLDLTERCEAIEELIDSADFDVTEKDGVFTMKLGSKGTYVINKQTPTRQLWFSSPVSGPKRYNYDIKTKKWRNNKDGHDMYDLLTKEIQSLLGIEWSMYENEK